MVEQFLFDSAFANGAYSHSFGLESYISWGAVKNADTYQEWLERYMMDVFATADGAVYAMACKLKDKKLSLLKLARVANASISSVECRAGAINMARATLKNTEFMHNDLAIWYSKICEDEKYAHPAIASSVLGDNMSADFAYATIKTLTQNATRAIPLSYKKSSELLYRNIELAKKSAEKSAMIADKILSNGCFSLQLVDKYADISFENSCIFATHHELDMAILAHEKLDFRLFMS